jgi:hypothetical protein
MRSLAYPDMKIISQSSDQLVLKEGSASGIVAGSVFAVAGVLVAIFLRDSIPYAIWIALALLVLGIAIILFSSSITVAANRTGGQLVYEKKRLVGGKTTTYAIADIFRIETRKQWRVDNSPPQGNQGASMPQPVLVAQSVIVFKNGSELALDHQKTSSTTTIGSMTVMGGQGAETAIAARVAEFLGVPFQEIMPPNMSSGMNIQF